MSFDVTQIEPSKGEPKRRRFQFRLRTLVIAVTLISVALGLFAKRIYVARRQAAAVAKLEPYGYVRYDYYYTESRTPPAPAWLCNLLGVDVFSDVVKVCLRDGATDEILPVLAELPTITSLDIEGRRITDVGLQALPSLPRLYGVNIAETAITDEGLQSLQGLPNLQYLHVNFTAVTDRGLEELDTIPKLCYMDVGHTAISDYGLKQLPRVAPNLVFLHLENTAVTSKGMAHLVQLEDLQFLWLGGTNVADDAINLFTTMPKLRELHLSETCLSESGATRLKALLPKCTVFYSPRFDLPPCTARRARKLDWPAMGGR